MLDGCCTEPQGHGSAVGPGVGSQHENAAGAGATYRQANRLEEAELSLGTVKSLSFLILYLVFEIP